MRVEHVKDRSKIRGKKPEAPTNGLPLDAVMDQLKSPGLGFDRVEHLPGSTYKDSSTVIVIPTRSKYKTEDGAEITGLIPHRVVSAWQNLIPPMNQKRAVLFASGHEVGEAYNAMIRMILAHPELSKWRYIMTMEDDNIPPPDAHIRLLESINWGNYDAVSGLYWTKGEVNMPMAYGSWDDFKRTGQPDFRPLDVRTALAAGNVIPCCGIAMGCALWKMQLFRDLPPPWYVTLNDLVPGKGIVGMTQDLSFCNHMIAAGKRVAVDARVKVGHIDVATGIVY
jgi:hypothetical protein